MTTKPHSEARGPSMTHRPYIGVTGVVTRDDVASISICATVLAASGQPHQLMAGVLVSAKTLRGERAANRRYPTAHDAEVLCARLFDAGAWPVVHFNTRTPAPLDEQLDALCRAVPSLMGIQLNVARPDPEALARFRWGQRPGMGPGVELILQVGGASLEALTPEAVLDYVRRYRASVHYALLDLSGGRGLPADTALAAAVVAAWDCPEVALGIAGGLGPEAGPLLADLRARCAPDRFRGLSFDAETGVRVPVADPTPGEHGQDTLNGLRALHYVEAVVDALAEAGPC